MKKLTTVPVRSLMGELSFSAGSLSQWLFSSKKIVRRYFTLMEVLVALVVVALVTSIFAVNIRSLWREQAFLDESSLLLNQLRLAQDMMQIMETDVVVSFQEKEGGYVSKIKAKSMAPALAQIMSNNSTLTFSTFGPLFFEDINGTVLEKDFVLTFFSRGFVMNHGSLQFGPKGSKDPTTVIVLRGYPEPLSLQPISSFNTQPSTAEQSIIERVTEATKQETAYDKEQLLEEEEEQEPVKNDKK